MKQVFLSYSTYDILQTIELRDFLESNDISCWMGKRDITPGGDYTVEISHAIDKCEFFVLILTENAQNSQFVKSEIECARAKKKIIIPYILEQFPISESFAFHIRDRQWIYVYENRQEAEKKLLLRLNNRADNETGTGTSDNAPEVNQAYHTNKIKCPICKSTNLRESDALEKLKSIANGFKSIRQFAWKTCITFIVIIIITFLLLILPTIRRNLEPFLYSIADFLFKNSSVLITPIHELGVAKQLLLISFFVISNYVFFFILPIMILALITNEYRAYRYRTFLQKGEQEVKCLCLECNQPFTVAFNTDAIIVRNERKTNTARNVLRAITSLLFMPFPIISVVLFIFINIVVRIIILLVKNKSTSKSILEKIISKLNLIPLIREEMNINWKFFCDEIDDYILDFVK